MSIKQYSIDLFLFCIGEHLFLPINKNICIAKKVQNKTKMLTFLIKYFPIFVLTTSRPYFWFMIEPESKLVGTQICRVVKVTSIFWSSFLDDQI
jgi:hypothetical protein